MRAEGGTPGEPRGKILVVEDDAPVRRLVERTLRNAYFHVIAASSVDEAKQALHEHGAELDLVLTDLRLDDGSGMDVVAEARAEAADAVIVVMTAMATVPNAVAAMRAGAYD